LKQGFIWALFTDKFRIMKNLFITILLAVFTCAAQAQIVTEKNLRDVGYGEKKLKKAPKKVFINQFSVNYQILSSSTEASSKSKSQMSVGLVGIELEDMQEITENAYELVVNKLTQAGFEIVESEEAGQTELYSDWVRLEGGTPSQAQLIGYVSTTPENFNYYVKKVKESGRTKGAYLVDITPKLSKELGDIPIFEANVNFQYVTIEGDTYFNDATRMKGTVNYQIPDKAVAQSAEGFFGAKIETSPTLVRFVWKGGAAGLGALTILSIAPKKKIEIPGVIEQKKFKQYASPNASYSTSYSSIVSRKEIEVTHQVKADREAFRAKTQQALNEYLTAVVDSFIASANR
jgi:hypothetical protein